MSDLHREQYPLLCDDLSEEEHYSPQYHRRHRSMTCRGRARNNLKGAAAILTRWPEHWSTFLTYWWIGLGMICLTTFFIYNSLFAFSALPTANLKSIKPRTKVSIIEHTSHKKPTLPEVYMHVFADYNQEVDLNTYLPYIEIISNQYVDFIYHLIVVVNDTIHDNNAMSAEHNNEMALNSLWTKDNKNMATDVKIEYISLSKYMDSSPLSKYWRSVSDEVLEFFLRAVSIWEKGGIAFNPHILTPLSPYSTTYIEKIRTILNKYESTTSAPTHKNLSGNAKPHKNTNESKQRVNNIRDIIDALDRDDNYNNLSEQILSEAENENSLVAAHSGRKLLSTATEVSENKTMHLTPNDTDDNNFSVLANIAPSQQMQNSNNSTMNLLPSFLEFLFHHKVLHSQGAESKQTNPKGKTIPYDRNAKDYITEEIVKKSNATNSLHEPEDILKNMTFKPIIIPAKEGQVIVDKAMKITEAEKLLRDGDENRLIIDLKGNFIATGTACHAFLGTIFSNAIHHSREETVANFIIRELSIFCKGVLSSCMGIELILL